MTDAEKTCWVALREYLASQGGPYELQRNWDVQEAIDDLVGDEPAETDGWIPWSGGECPVHPDTIVEIEFSSGIRPPASKASYWSWSWPPGTNGSDIVAYRVTESTTPEENCGRSYGDVTNGSTPEQGVNDSWRFAEELSALEEENERMERSLDLYRATQQRMRDEIELLRRKVRYYINEARDHRWRWTEHANTSTKLLEEKTELASLLYRAIEAIESTISLDDGNLTGSERQWVIDQAVKTVADIRAALKEQV